jgi:hypothetical protein
LIQENILLKGENTNLIQINQCYCDNLGENEKENVLKGFLLKNASKELNHHYNKFEDMKINLLNLDMRE